MIQVLKDMPKSNSIQFAERRRLVIKLAFVKAVRQPVTAMPFYVHRITLPWTPCERFQEFSASATHVQDSPAFYKTFYNAPPSVIQPHRSTALVGYLMSASLLFGLITTRAVI